MIVLFGALATAVITGFMVFRSMIGHYLRPTANQMIVASVLLVLVYAIRGGRTQRGGAFSPWSW